jgi:hypothetical protein
MAILLVEGYFTWSNKQDPPSWLRIDRFLVSPEWETQFLKKKGYLDFAQTISLFFLIVAAFKVAKDILS